MGTDMNKKVNEIFKTTMEVPEKIADVLMHSTFTKTEDVAKNISKSINRGATDSISYATDMTNKKIAEATSKLQDAMPAIEQSGYVLHSMDIDIGVLPKIVTRYSIGHDVSDEEKNRILQENKKNRFTFMLLSSLLTASKVKDYIKLGEMKFHEVEVHLSSTPKIKLRFNKAL